MQDGAGMMEGERDIGTESGAYMRLHDVGLSLPTYVQHDRKGDSWAKMLLGAAVDRPERKMIRILDGINADIVEGDRVALIGRNGAGKTTLLNVLTGCYLPTTGGYEVNGSCQALLNVSLGFNYEATVRENILLRGTAMGIPLAELKEQITPILEFAGLEGASASRLATLSAGQRMRLGFAISTSVQPDIMLLDEWIGAGDAEFLAKARERMQSRVNGSRILVLASHSSDLLKRVCNRGLVLEGGRVVHDSGIAEALRYYMDMMKGESRGSETASKPLARRIPSHAAAQGFSFDFPVHVLFENKAAAGSAGDLAYGLLVEFEGTKPAAVVQQLNRKLHAGGWELADIKGGAMPDTFVYEQRAGGSIEMTVTPYGVNDRRENAAALGRLHLKVYK